MIGKNKTSNNIQLAEMVTFFKEIEGVTFNHQMFNRDKTDFILCASVVSHLHIKINTLILPDALTLRL